jgi:hypothetical protein
MCRDWRIGTYPEDCARRIGGKKSHGGHKLFAMPAAVIVPAR